MRDKSIQRDDELSDSEDEGSGGRKHREDRKQRTASPPSRLSPRSQPEEPMSSMLQSPPTALTPTNVHDGLPGAPGLVPLESVKSPPRVISTGEGADGGAGRVGIMDSMDVDMDVDSDEAEEGEVKQGDVVVMPPSDVAGNGAEEEEEGLVNEDTEMGAADGKSEPIAGIEAPTASEIILGDEQVMGDPSLAVVDFGTQNYPSIPEGTVPHLNTDAPSSAMREEKKD